MCIRRETREKARRSLAFSRVSKPHTHITHMLRQCTSIVYISIGYMGQFIVVCIQIKMLHDKILKTIKCDILNVNSDGKIGVSYLTNQTSIKIREI